MIINVNCWNDGQIMFLVERVSFFKWSIVCVSERYSKLSNIDF